MAREPILNNNKTRLRLFEAGIKMDESLPKHKEYKEFKEKEKLLKEAEKLGDKLDMAKADIDLLRMEVQANVSNVNNNSILVSGSTGFDDTLFPKKGIPSYEKLKAMFLDDTTLESCKIQVTDYMKEIMEKNRWAVNFTVPTTSEALTLTIKQENIWNKLKVKLGLIKDADEFINGKTPEFDVIAFFNRVKLETEDVQNKYVNRLKELVECIAYCDVTGQVALKERLFEQLTVNKYESVLYANGFYKAVSEARIVEFAQNSKKGLALDYMQNFGRAIPTDVIMKKLAADKLGVFDNYVILHYDPEATTYIATEREKRKEAEKKKDPILFGVIMGSDKLYYIGDWVDEYCDLTFEALAEKVGKDIIEKDFIKETINMKV